MDENLWRPLNLWLPVVGYEGLYLVSDDGRVMSLTRNKLRAIHKNRKSGYMRVILCKDGITKNHSVHRLMAFAFLGEPAEEGMEVAHNDGVRHHNVLSNLRWDTKSGNQADRRKHGTENKLRGEQVGNSKLKEKDVFAIRRDARVQSKIAADYGIAQSLVSLIKTRAVWAHI